MNFLDKIIKIKKKELANVDIRNFDNEPLDTVSLKDSLSLPGVSVIAEIKMKSPSEGDIFTNADPIQIAKDYQSAGAKAISILTDERYFGGSIEILESVKNVVSIPVIRKDFIISKYQIAQAGNAGADAFLLISELLDANLISHLIDFGKELNLESIIECHTKENAEMVSKLSPDIVGVNCRDLKTMKTDINAFGEIASIIPSSSLKIAESGIHCSDDLKYISNLGYDGVLIGTSLMKTGNPGKALEILIEGLG